MARRKTQFAQGEYYHIFNRGCDRQNIFREEENYVLATRLLLNSLECRRVSMIAYCLMPNHYHFLMRQDSRIPINMVIFDVFNSYVKVFNQRYGRSGTLFEERFKAKHVRNDGYLFHLCRYIHRNPLDAGIVDKLEFWKYSDYSQWASGTGSTHLVWSAFSNPTEYVKFVGEYKSYDKAGLVLRGYAFD